MNKTIALRMLSMALMMMICISCSSQKKPAAPVVGTLTAYYAKENFNAGDIEYKKGQLICDSNDPINRVVEQDDEYYKYEGDDTGEYYSWLLPKSKVEKKTYTMNQLSVENVGLKANYVSEDACAARIFWSTINGHKYYGYDGEEELWRETERLSECYVLSAEFISVWDGKKYFFEDQLEEKRGNIKLYAENRFALGSTNPSDCRYREGLIGFIEERWNNQEGWDYTKTAFSDEGKLLADQWEIADIPDYISIAYIGALDALYINGVIYYRK